jgi:hypothetical protein
MRSTKLAAVGLALVGVLGLSVDFAVLPAQPG